jgi:hypothetical protein
VIALKAVKITVFTLVIFVAIMMFMLLASMLDQEPSETGSSSLISVQSLIAALPTGLLSFLLAKLTRPATWQQGAWTGLIWAIAQMGLFLVIGYFNQTLPLIFGAAGFYVLMLFIPLGAALAELRRKTG